MQFILTIDIDSSVAMRTRVDIESALQMVARHFHKDGLPQLGEGGEVKAENGNTVGHWAITKDGEFASDGTQSHAPDCPQRVGGECVCAALATNYDEDAKVAGHDPAGDTTGVDYHHDTLPDTGFPDSTTDEREAQQFKAALSGFLAAAQAKVNEHMKQYAPMQAVRLDTQDGQRYVRVVAIDTVNGHEAENGSAYCFIDKENGNVLKPAGWKGPEKKNPRSNIYAQDFGASGVTGYGTVSLRR